MKKNTPKASTSYASSREDDDNDSDETQCSVGSNSTASTQRTDTPTGKGRLSRKGRRRNQATKSKQSNEKSLYKYSCMVKEDHGQALFGVSINTRLQESEPIIFATVGSNRVTIFECPKDGSIKLLQCYLDPDAEEKFYTCAWTRDDQGRPLLAAAGVRGVIRIVSPVSMTSIRDFTGHGKAINDLKINPCDPNILLSASKDHSLRLWNIKTGECIAIFAGDGGHRDEVLSADFHMAGNKIISCGIDHALKIWSLDKPELTVAMKLSYAWNSSRIGRAFPTVSQHFPDFTTRDIHRNYVDCVKWYGDFVLSKSCEGNSIVCWKPGPLNDTQLRKNETNTSIIHRFKLKDCDIWFIRFSLDVKGHTLALGNQVGNTYVWDLKVEDPVNTKCYVLQNPHCKSVIRQTSLSRDASVLICVCDDATIWRWNRVTE